MTEKAKRDDMAETTVHKTASRKRVHGNHGCNKAHDADKTKSSASAKAPSARGIAIEILNRIELSDAYAEPLLDAHLSSPDSTLAKQDKGLITELVYGTLRNRNRLDWAISLIYSGNFEAMETAVRNILRVGVYQLFHTDRIPPFAIVNEAVETARMIRPGVEGLVNAVLRNIIRKKEQIPWPELSGNVSKAISVSYSHPLWLVERLRKLHGTDETIAICRANNEIPPFTLRVNTLKATRENIIEQLKNEDIFTEPTLFSPEGITVSEGAAGLRDSVAFRQGLIRVQDEASQLVAHLLAPRPGARALDACAGSGGKTLHIGALMDNTGEIIATDINRSRLGMLTTEARRLGVSIVRTGMADDDGKSRAEIGLFDYVLVDAPCSGLGTLRRNPEIRWRLKESDIMLFQKKQMTLLKNAAEYVKPGGSLAYCVCTTTPEETTEVAAGFLGADSRFRVSAPRKLPVGIVTAEGFLLTLPHRHGLDGFFGALLMRQE